MSGAPDRWRITVEYLPYEQARAAGDLLRATMPEVYCFDALDRDGESLWHERGSLHFRPERDR